MAKILVSCSAADGHVNPFLLVVSNLVQLGHEIVWIGGRQYRKRIESTGAEFEPMPETFDPNGMDIYDFKPELKKLKGLDQIKFYIRTWSYDAAIPTLAIIEDIRKRFEPDLYISDPMVYALYFKAELLNKPSINLHVIPLPFSSKDHGPFGTGLPPTNKLIGKLRIKLMNLLVDKILFRDLKKECDELRKGIGLQPYNHIFNGFIKSASKVLTVTIPGFDYQRSDMSENIEYIGPIFPKVNQKFSKPNW